MAPLDRYRIRQSFGRAAASYATASALQREVESRLLERIELLREAPQRIVDIGCGPGRAAALLKRRYRHSEVIALDLALPMLRETKRNSRWWRPLRRVCGDAQALPLADASADLIFSNLCVQWCADLGRVFDEFRRVLKPDGLLLLSSFGPDTLQELRAAWSAADAHPHVNAFLDIRAYGDALLAAGFRDPVVDVDHFRLDYADARDLMRELKAIGASNADQARARGLTGKARLQRMLAAYEPLRNANGLLPASYEVIYAQAFGAPAGQPRRSPSGELASFPAAAIKVLKRDRQN